MADDDLEVPEREKGDAAHAIAKAVLSALPIVGGAAAELFQSLIQPPLERRRDKWMEQVGEELAKLAEAGFSLEGLQENEEFVSVVATASQIALRTHQEEKIAALRNAIANVAKGQAPDETLQHIFLNLVDSFTELHIRILKLFQAPNPPSSLGMGGLGNVLEHNMPELRGNRELYDQIWTDLYSRGLVNTQQMHITMSGPGLAQKRTTPMGDAFLTFIEEHD